MKWYVWHNTRGVANQYFICKGTHVYWQIPKWLGKLFRCIDGD